ncbi:piwi-like protein 3 [Ochotona princeps]|uniref:piwi-like protein 3 n=1 Tax=Ochotona princeps TaxID=9978 RepID=UPI00271492E0|nr:piwi-like protein 3 [Ochotona princeps]
MKSDGSFISFAEHCKERYKQAITDFEQPMLVSFGKWKKGKEKTQCERIKLIPQLCTLTGIAERVRRNHLVMQNLSAYTRLSPQTRWNKVRNFISDLSRYRCVQEEFKTWDMEFDYNLLKVPARILEDTKIFRGKAWCEAKRKHAEWSKSVTLLSAKKMKKWAIVYAASCESLANYLSARLINVASQMGMTVEIPQMENLNERDTYQSKVKSLGKTAQIVLCLLPNEEKARYDSIKKLLCEEIPILSQCVVARTVDKAQTTPPIISKIVQQMNCKLGGALWKVDIDLKKTMFIGIDCFHDVAHKDQSVAGFVASSNEELTQWYSHTIEQSTAQEVVFALEGCLQEAIEQWKKNVSSEPKNIIVYRDGVGDGQLKNLQTTEILKLENYLDAKFPFKIGLTFIVVKKRINTRFFAQSREYVNPTPGTVIDTELTRLQWYDFYIVSQSVREGTVTPTHYNVIHDTVRLQPDVVQRLTYQLCHMYYNVTDMIRVPAPCHYAHKLAYLVGRSLKKEPSKKLSECLYYL